MTVSRDAEDRAHHMLREILDGMTTRAQEQGLRPREVHVQCPDCEGLGRVGITPPWAPPEAQDDGPCPRCGEETTVPWESLTPAEQAVEEARGFVS